MIENVTFLNVVFVIFTAIIIGLSINLLRLKYVEMVVRRIIAYAMLESNDCPTTIVEEIYRLTSSVKDGLYISAEFAGRLRVHYRYPEYGDRTYAIVNYWLSKLDKLGVGALGDRTKTTCIVACLKSMEYELDDMERVSLYRDLRSIYPGKKNVKLRYLFYRLLLIPQENIPAEATFHEIDKLLGELK